MLFTVNEVQERVLNHEICWSYCKLQRPGTLASWSPEEANSPAAAPA